jgi:hypothetical protein
MFKKFMHASLVAGLVIAAAGSPARAESHMCYLILTYEDGGEEETAIEASDGRSCQMVCRQLLDMKGATYCSIWNDVPGELEE